MDCNDELIPGLSEKIRKWNGDNVSKIKEIIKHMKAQEVPMTAISVKEATKITNSTEASIQSHLSPNKYFSKMKEKGMYALLDKPRKNRKERMADIEKKHKETENKPPLAGYYGEPKKPVIKEDAEIEPQDKKDIPLADNNSDIDNHINQDGMGEKPTQPKKAEKTSPPALIQKTAFFCPHCNQEVSTVSMAEIKKLCETLRNETRPIEEHTDPNAIKDCWNMLFAELNKNNKKVIE